MTEKKIRGWVKKTISHCGIILFSLTAFEVVIMISPFAFFFYSVFNPIFQWLSHYSSTKWLITFFLPHMILPPTLVLKTVRILGSFFFIIGSLVFIVCALQLYLGKIFKRGIVNKGLYAYIRHPQYVALEIWGIGMAILWPRFIVLVTLSLMFVLYYFLAKDEERRMINQYGESYKSYMKNTGMLLPQFIENLFSIKRLSISNNHFRYAVVPVLTFAIVIGAGFLLRLYTLNSLPFKTHKNITLISILPEDNVSSTKILDIIFDRFTEKEIDFLKDRNDYLGYIMRPNYIMQGMIANTGGRFHLHKKHHTFALLSDWIFHPFRHLRRPPLCHRAKLNKVDSGIAQRHHCPIGINFADINCENCPYRRVILVEIRHKGKNGQNIYVAKLLSFNTRRVPVGFIDINTQTGEIINLEKVKKGTAWKDVPTPAI